MEDFVVGFFGMAIILIFVCAMIGIVAAAAYFFGGLGAVVGVLFVICMGSGVAEWAKRR